jgi:serine/threonine protein kinase
VLGDGAFGTVTKCRDKETGEFVAVKKIKQRFPSFDECLQLKEVKSLRKIKHQNVVKLLQIFRESEIMYLVFELMGESLVDTMEKKNNHFSEPEIREIMLQIFTGLAYIHKQGFFHRDMKPDNLLWKDDVLKICDFGLAKEIRARPPFTEYVSTRWYRAPEIICRSPYYNCPVDIWAAGAIMCELYMGKPIFPGISDTDQLFKIIDVLGTPTVQQWPDLARLQQKMRLRFATVPPMALELLMPNACPEAVSLLRDIFRYDPAKRPSANQILQHPFFQGSASRNFASPQAKTNSGPFAAGGSRNFGDSIINSGPPSGRRAISSASVVPDSTKVPEGMRKILNHDEQKKRYGEAEPSRPTGFSGNIPSVGSFNAKLTTPPKDEPRRPPLAPPRRLDEEPSPGNLRLGGSPVGTPGRRLTDTQDFEALLDELGKDL